jgi:hypothetical protein
MRVIWRFFVADTTQWRWQQLSDDRTVVAESPMSYETYDSCVAAARAQGYVFEATQGRLTRPGNDHRYPRR